MSIRRVSNLLFCPLALSRNGDVSSKIKLDFALAMGSSQSLVEHPIVGGRASSRLCLRYGVEASGFLPATIVMTHTINKFGLVMRPEASA